MRPLVLFVRVLRVSVCAASCTYTYVWCTCVQMQRTFAKYRSHQINRFPLTRHMNFPDRKHTHGRSYILNFTKNPTQQKTTGDSRKDREEYSCHPWKQTYKASQKAHIAVGSPGQSGRTSTATSAIPVGFLFIGGTSWKCSDGSNTYCSATRTPVAGL